jgi:hypothetical protein
MSMSEEERKEVFSVSPFSYLKNLLRLSLNANVEMALQRPHHPHRDREAEYAGVRARPPPCSESGAPEDLVSYEATLRSLLEKSHPDRRRELERNWRKYFPGKEVPRWKDSRGSPSKYGTSPS